MPENAGTCIIFNPADGTLILPDGSKIAFGGKTRIDCQGCRYFPNWTRACHQECIFFKILRPDIIELRGASV